MGKRFFSFKDYEARRKAERGAAAPQTPEQRAAALAALDEAVRLCNAIADHELNFSSWDVEWARSKARTAKRCALAIQMLRDSAAEPEHSTEAAPAN